jgi:hypothetical protein
MRWEYKIIYIDATRWSPTGLPEELGVRFDELGDEGWELVKVEPILTGSWGVFLGSKTKALISFFRRPKQ